MGTSEIPDAARNGSKRGRYAVARVIVILLLGLGILLLCPYLRLFYAFTDRETVAQSEAPGGGLTLSAEKNEFFGSCYFVTARQGWFPFSTDIGASICPDYHSFTPFDGENQRFEWFEDRGMVALVADGAGTQPNGQPYDLYIRLFRYNDAGNVSELSMDDLRADPKDSPDFTGDYAWRDRRIRALLGLTTPASPDAEGTQDAIGTPSGARP